MTSVDIKLNTDQLLLTATTDQDIPGLIPSSAV